MAYGGGVVAARRLGATLASFVGLSEVLFAVLFAFVLLEEGMTALQLAGGALVVVGVGLVQAGERAPGTPHHRRTPCSPRTLRSAAHARVRNLRPMRVHAEFTTEPFRGEPDPPAHATGAFDVVRAAGLEADFGPLGTSVGGEAEAVVAALADVMRVALAQGATRVTLLLEKEPEHD